MMGKIFFQYLVSAIFLLCGLASLFYALTKKKNEIEKYQEDIHPLPKNYGKSFFIFFGAVLLLLGISIIFIKAK